MYPCRVRNQQQAMVVRLAGANVHAFFLSPWKIILRPTKMNYTLTGNPSFLSLLQNIGTINANVSAIQTTVSDIKTSTDTISDIKTSTDDISDIKTSTDTISGIQSTVSTIKTNVDAIKNEFVTYGKFEIFISEGNTGPFHIRDTEANLLTLLGTYKTTWEHYMINSIGLINGNVLHLTYLQYQQLTTLETDKQRRVFAGTLGITDPYSLLLNSTRLSNVFDGVESRVNTSFLQKELFANHMGTTNQWLITFPNPSFTQNWFGAIESEDGRTIRDQYLHPISRKVEHAHATIWYVETPSNHFLIGNNENVVSMAFVAVHDRGSGHTYHGTALNKNHPTFALVSLDGPAPNPNLSLGIRYTDGVIISKDGFDVSQPWV